MSNEECAQTYAKLVEMLRRYKLDWVIDQVEEQIRLGKTIEKEIETLKEVREKATMYSTEALIAVPASKNMFPAERHTSQLMKGPKATFPVTVEYQPSERLILLIDAIDRVVIKTAYMEQHVAKYFSEQGTEWQSVSFYNEESNEPSLLIDSQPISIRHTSVSDLEMWLKELREQI